MGINESVRDKREDILRIVARNGAMLQDSVDAFLIF